MKVTKDAYRYSAGLEDIRTHEHLGRAWQAWQVRAQERRKRRKLVKERRGNPMEEGLGRIWAPG